MTFDELTPAQREEIQECWMRQHLGRLQRAEWERSHRVPVETPAPKKVPSATRWKRQHRAERLALNQCFYCENQAEPCHITCAACRAERRRLGYHLLRHYHNELETAK